MWLKELQIAIIEKNTDRINTLLDDVPALEKKSEIDSALSLLSEATILLKSLRDDTRASMQQMQKNIHYLKSTQEKQSSSFDISS